MKKPNLPNPKFKAKTKEGGPALPHKKHHPKPEFVDIAFAPASRRGNIPTPSGG
ncbi:MAG: hypothetical protein ACNA7W_19030 [Pseudomonadales bacterium]